VEVAPQYQTIAARQMLLLYTSLGKPLLSISWLFEMLSDGIDQ
jgi:hypothetical protein